MITQQTTTLTADQVVQKAIENTIQAEGKCNKYAMGPRTLHRPHGSYISNIPGGSSLLPADASEEDINAICNLLLECQWREITDELTEGQRMGKNRYYETNLPSWVEAYQAAVHFTEYLDLINASDEVRQGKQPVPGLEIRVGFHKGPDLSSDSLPPQPTNKYVLAVGATQWREELYYGSNWHYVDEDPLQVIDLAKVFFGAPGVVLPAGSTVKLHRPNNLQG